MISAKTKRNVSRIISFAVICLVFSTVYSLLEKGILGDLNYYPATGNPYNIIHTFFITFISTLIIGILIGSLEILIFNRVFTRKSFGKKILFKSIIYLVIIIVFLLITAVISNAIELHTSAFDKRVWDNVWAFFSGYSFWGVEIYVAVIIVVCLFYIEVTENLGYGVLANFFIGKYHTPIEEERIYMFLDMKSSTTIAESLGHVKYFEMLREYYSDLSDPIIKYSGEIYQYVGDEVIVSWKLKDGLQDNNCVQCFFAMKEAIKAQNKKYDQQFGVLPEFKAGFHLGKVTTGEIGVIKKDIIFTGDVLNATARIQSLCNTYKVDILISGELVKKLDPGSRFQLRSFGENELRGRDEKIELFTIT